MWSKDSPEYNPALGGRLRVASKFCFPVFMMVFGVVMMFAGVGTAILFELSPTRL